MCIQYGRRRCREPNCRGWNRGSSYSRHLAAAGGGQGRSEDEVSRPGAPALGLMKLFAAASCRARGSLGAHERPGSSRNVEYSVRHSHRACHCFPRDMSCMIKCRASERRRVDHLHGCQRSCSLDAQGAKPWLSGIGRIHADAECGFMSIHRAIPDSGRRILRAST